MIIDNIYSYDCRFISHSFLSLDHMKVAYCKLHFRILSERTEAPTLTNADGDGFKRLFEPKQPEQIRSMCVTCLVTLPSRTTMANCINYIQLHDQEQKFGPRIIATSP